MIDEDFFEEVTVKRRAKEVSSGNIWGRAFQGVVTTEGSFFF